VNNLCITAQPANNLKQLLNKKHNLKRVVMVVDNFPISRTKRTRNNQHTTEQGHFLLSIKSQIRGLSEKVKSHCCHTQDKR